MLGNSGTHVWSQSLYKRPPYNTITDFTPVSLVVESPRTLITPKTFPANSLPEFIAYVKANQTTVKYGSAGAGSASHVSCVLFNAAIGINVTHVPYRGLAPAMQDLTAGRVDYLCDSPSTTLPQIKGDFLKVLATTGARCGAASGANRARTGPAIRRNHLASDLPAQGHAGCDRPKTQSSDRRDSGYAFGA